MEHTLIMNKQIIYLFVLLLVLLTQGCAILGSNPYHKATTLEPASEGHMDLGGFAYIRFGGQNVLTVKKEDVVVTVRSIGTDAYSPLAMGPVLPIIPLFITARDKPRNNVILEIYLKLKTDNFTFNPMLVRLKNSKGIEFAPASYMNGSHAFAWYLGNAITSESKDIQLNNNSRYCFVLEFDMESSPDWNFTMQVNGMKRDGNGISSPEFQFERGTAIFMIWGGRERFCSEMEEH